MAPTVSHRTDTLSFVVMAIRWRCCTSDGVRREDQRNQSLTHVVATNHFESTPILPRWDGSATVAFASMCLCWRGAALLLGTLRLSALVALLVLVVLDCCKQSVAGVGARDGDRVVCESLGHECVCGVGRGVTVVVALARDAGWASATVSMSASMLELAKA